MRKHLFCILTGIFLVAGFNIHPPDLSVSRIIKSGFENVQSHPECDCRVMFPDKEISGKNRVAGDGETSGIGILRNSFRTRSIIPVILAKHRTTGAVPVSGSLDFLILEKGRSGSVFPAVNPFKNSGRYYIYGLKRILI